MKTALEQIVEITKQEGLDNEAFKKWISSDPDYCSIGKSGKECLIHFVAALNIEIADLKSEIVRLKQIGLKMTDKKLCFECKKELGYVPKGEGYHTAIVAKCDECNEVKSILPLRHYKKIDRG